jgi:hypothetical protein
MKYGILFVVLLGFFGARACQSTTEAETASTEPPLEDLSATAQEDLSSEEYYRSVMQEAKLLLNSDDPRVWEQAMMSE